jgi:fumarate reductase subunit C
MYEFAFCFNLLYAAFSDWHPAIIWICFIGFLSAPFIVVIPYHQDATGLLVPLSSFSENVTLNGMQTNP